jgi:hypothetical protein
MKNAYGKRQMKNSNEKTGRSMRQHPPAEKKRRSFRLIRIFLISKYYLKKRTNI